MKNHIIVFFMSFVSCVIFASCKSDSTSTVIADFTEQSLPKLTETHEKVTSLTTAAIVTTDNTSKQKTSVVSDETEASSDTISAILNMYAEEIVNIAKKPLESYPWDENYEKASGDEDFYESAEKKYKLLLDSFMQYPKNYETFGGAYCQNGYLIINTTDIEKFVLYTEIVGDHNVIIEECSYSYTYLLKTENFISSLKGTLLTSYYLNPRTNQVAVTALTEDLKNQILSELETNGYDKNTVEIRVTDAVYAMPT